MHESKIIEIRDHMTFIPALAVALQGYELKDDKIIPTRGGRMLWIAGYAPQNRYVILHHLQTGEVHNDPAGWENKRTMPTAHRHLILNWHEIEDGGLIDVRVVLGETDVPCKTDVPTQIEEP